MPRCGPLRPLVTFLDANRALLYDLPPGWLKSRPHWRHAGEALVHAAETGTAESRRYAYEALVFAIGTEGWFNSPPRAEAPR